MERLKTELLCLAQHGFILPVDERHACQGDHVAGEEDGLLDALVVDEGAACRVQVEDHVTTVDLAQLGVDARDAAIVDAQVVVGAAPDVEDGLREGEDVRAIHDQEGVLGRFLAGLPLPAPPRNRWSQPGWRC